MDTGKTIENMKKRGFSVSFFETKETAAEYLENELAGDEIGIGGSVTAAEMQLYERLSKRSTVHSHTATKDESERMKAYRSPVYITSANGVSETGELVNIDGSGNRIGATMYDKQKVYFVIGTNKIEPSLDKAIARARNIAAPRNAQRLQKKTPCAVDGVCHDCRAPERICRCMAITMAPMLSCRKTEVVIINEPLGY